MLSESARDLLRRRLDGDSAVNDLDRPAYRELVAAGILYPMSGFAGGPESSYRFTEDGWARRQEWLALESPAAVP